MFSNSYRGLSHKQGTPVAPRSSYAFCWFWVRCCSCSDFGRNHVNISVGMLYVGGGRGCLAQRQDPSCLPAGLGIRTGDLSVCDLLRPKRNFVFVRLESQTSQKCAKSRPKSSEIRQNFPETQRT